MIELLPAASSQASVLQVRAHDVPGLLYRITGALAGAGVTVTTALVDTLGSDVVDVFYLRRAGRHAPLGRGGGAGGGRGGSGAGRRTR